MDDQSNQKVYIDLVFHPLHCLGPNKRIGVWFQGCNIGCIDCIAVHTWEQTENKLMTVTDLIDEVKCINISRLTISGGEPFNQSKALYAFLQGIRMYFDDILIYSGYEYKYLHKKYPEILELVDVLVDGPFKKELETTKNYKGSKNQKMYIFNNNLVSSYEKYLRENKKVLQVHQIKNNIYVLGIPHVSDSKNIQKILNGEI